MDKSVGLTLVFCEGDEDYCTTFHVAKFSYLTAHLIGGFVVSICIPYLYFMAFPPKAKQPSRRREPSHVQYGFDGKKDDLDFII